MYADSGVNVQIATINYYWNRLLFSYSIYVWKVHDTQAYQHEMVW